MNLFLIRGLPGAGKSTFANQISGVVFEADMFFERHNGGRFDARKLSSAHAWCRAAVSKAMRDAYPTIAVANTFTRDKEMKSYEEMAKYYGYTVFVVTVENRHGGESMHNVPTETIQKMRDRFKVNL